ncbi:MAG: ParB N-terminal domain-containing protein [Erysipelotrichaceae bacterium]|nr:ParB N-terminal domain-containing protein [Erysipelotrichaceae bacterium]
MAGVIDKTFEKSFDLDGVIEEVDTSEYISRIPLKMIKPREVNEYSKGKIAELAQSIKDAGMLINPITVYVNPDKTDKIHRYIISSGERRFRAYNLLLSEAKKNKDKEAIAKYSYIQGHILSADEQTREDVIYRVANDTARQEGVYERVVRLHLNNDTFKDLEKRREYVQMIYGQDGLKRYEGGSLSPKFNLADLRKYGAKLFAKQYPESEISSNTVEKYILYVYNSSKELIDAILDDKVALRDGIRMSGLEKETQRAMLEEMKEGKTIGELLKPYISLKTPAAVNTSSVPVIKDELSSVGRGLIKVLDKSDLESINRRDLNGNQKEYLKQVERILKAINTLKMMPEK